MDELDTRPLMETSLPLPLYARGKVRDIYDLGSWLLIVATDRISAFDVVLPNGIPGKGAVLNQMSIFWFRLTSDIIANHLLEAADNPSSLKPYLSSQTHFRYPSFLSGRSMIAKKVKRLPVECVVRGYLAGSVWEEYRQSGTVAGIPLPGSLRESDELRHPIFTPTTKADSGHDKPLTGSQLDKLVGKAIAGEMASKALQIYGFARDYARARGIIIADTKMEFGLDDDKLILIDELLTPDSSRFWSVDTYKPGRSQPSFDKQPVRDWLTQTGWNKKPPAPELPQHIVRDTAEKYIQAFECLTGQKLKFSPTASP